MKTKLVSPLTRWLLLVTAIILLVTSVSQIFSQAYFTNYVAKIYEENIEVTVSRITTEINKTFTSMNSAVYDISESRVTKDYASTRDSETRYAKAFENVKPVVDVAIQNKGFDKLVTLDHTGAWYRFDSSKLTSSDGHKLKAFFENSNCRDGASTVMDLDEGIYYCAIRAITNYEPGQYESKIVGYVAALSSIENTRLALKEFGDNGKFTICLYDNDSILISNNPAIDGSKLAYFSENSDLYVNYSEIIPGSLGVLVSIPYDEIFPNKGMLSVMFLIVGSLAFVLIVVLSIFINRIIVKPFSTVIDETAKLGDNNLSVRISKTGVNHVDVLVSSINEMLTRLEDSTRNVIKTQQTLYELELTSRDTQMYLLRNQIDRHFLYNSLSSVSTLADRGESEKVKEIATGIAQLLRYTSSALKEVNIFDELGIVQSYVNIQNIRFDNRMNFEIEVDDNLCNYRILKLLIQPLVENSLIHGLEAKQNGICTLWLKGELLDDHIRIEVRDNGLGIPAEKLEAIKTNIENYNEKNILGRIEGIALVNIQKRLAMEYGPEYRLTIDSVENEFTSVVLTFPKVPDTML